MVEATMSRGSAWGDKPPALERVLRPARECMPQRRCSVQPVTSGEKPTWSLIFKEMRHVVACILRGAFEVLGLQGIPRGEAGERQMTDTQFT